MVVVLVELTDTGLKKVVSHRWHSVNVSLIIHNTIFLSFLLTLIIDS